MAVKPKQAEKTGVSIWRIVGAVFTIVVLISYLMYHASFVTGRSMLLAFPGWETTYRACWPNPFGGAWVSDVTLMPVEGDEEDAFHFDHLTVDVPFFQFYRAGFAKKTRDRLKAISDIRLEFSGGHGSLAWPFSSELFFFGTASASPFEAEGCVEDGAWWSDELTEMGLNAGPTELSMAWHRDSDSLVKEQSIHTPGVARVDYREEQIMHDGFPLFSLIETDENELALSEWHIRDEGFVAARNQFCAHKDGIETTEFVDRHVATVRRVLAAVGMQPDEATEAAYRRYTESGAPLDLVVSYAPTIDAAIYDDDDWGRWLARAHPKLKVGDREIAIAMHAVEPRPFAPSDDDDKTPFALLQMEQNRALAAHQRETNDDAPPPGPGHAAVVAATPDSAAPEVLMAYPAEVVERPDTILDYRKLGAEKGQRFMVYLKGKSPMKVEVVGSEEGLVKVRRYLRSGWLEHTIARASFERAVRIH